MKEGRTNLICLGKSGFYMNKFLGRKAGVVGNISFRLESLFFNKNKILDFEKKILMVAPLGGPKGAIQSKGQQWSFSKP